VVRTPAVAIALHGIDRRCFGDGSALPDWLTRDPGVLVRIGLYEEVNRAAGCVAVDDTWVADAAPAAIAARELGIGSYLAAPLSVAGGEAFGILFAFDTLPRMWSEEERGVMAGLATAAATEVDLRRRIAERELVESHLRYVAYHDPLTGLPNRVLFTERLAEAVERAKRDPADHFAILFLDLDNFKLVNDSMGHYAGDELLVEIAHRIGQVRRGNDMVARLGGDEFAILLNRVSDARAAAIVAERIQRALSAPIDVGGYELFTSASIGIVLSTTAHEQPAHLLRSADMAMYRAKTSGRGRFEIFDRGMHTAALVRLQLETDLHRAVERDEFVLHFQPVIALDTGRIAGVEALIRWRHPERGIVSPLDFVEAAEDTGLILRVDSWVLAAACRQLREWHELHPELHALTMAVNLSRKPLVQLDLADRVARMLGEFGISPSQLTLEITESALIEQREVVLHVLADLERLGVQIHLDDFGTGFSSLSDLHRFPVHALKVDRGFIDSLEAEDRSRQLVRTILALSRNLGVGCVAEGVATAEQLHFLRSLGCDYAQGYYFSAPLDAERMTRLLLSQPRW
jgi:diguanylate cyclase (GGDEF)-like protein